MKTKTYRWDKVTGTKFVDSFPPNGFDREEIVPLDQDCFECKKNKEEFLKKVAAIFGLGVKMRQSDYS